MVLSNALNHLLNQHRLAHTCTTEQADLAALNVWGEKVDHLDAGFEHLGARFELVEGWGIAVDVPALGHLDLLAFLLVEDVASSVENVAQGHITNWNADLAAGILHNRAADQAIGWLQSDATHHRVADVLLDLKGDGLKLLALFLGGRVELHLQSIVNIRDVAHRELNVDHRTLYSDDAALRSVLVLLRSFLLRGLGGILLNSCLSHDAPLPYLFFFSASAPLTISVSSCVICAWRVWFSSRVS